MITFANLKRPLLPAIITCCFLIITYLFCQVVAVLLLFTGSGLIAKTTFQLFIWIGYLSILPLFVTHKVNLLPLTTSSLIQILFEYIYAYLLVSAFLFCLA